MAPDQNIPENFRYGQPHEYGIPLAIPDDLVELSVPARELDPEVQFRAHRGWRKPSALKLLSFIERYNLTALPDDCITIVQSWAYPLVQGRFAVKRNSWWFSMPPRIQPWELALTTCRDQIERLSEGREENMWFFFQFFIGELDLEQLD